MTREEAIQALKDLADMNVRYGCDDKWITALQMAIETLSDRLTDEWCTDCKEYDHDKHCCPRFNRVIRTTLNEVVYCKDCRQYIPHDLTEAYGWCCEFKTPIEEDDFCSRGERRKE